MHGLGRTASSMRKAAKYFSSLGYETLNIGYPSRRLSVPEISSDFLVPGITGLGDFQKVHILSHSMGCIVARYYLQNNSLPGNGRVVMLAPPNKGSEIIDFFKSNTVLNEVGNYILGSGGMSLSSEEDAFPNSLATIPLTDIGVIAGNCSIDFWSRPLFKSCNDGKVSIESAKLIEMKDFLLVEANHTFIMRSPKVLRQAEYFFQNACFDKPH